MVELVELYAMLANAGEHRPIRTRVSESLESGSKLLSAEASHLTLEMLEANPRPWGSYRGARLDEPIAVPWKTGTSHGFRDAWSIGVVGPYVLAVWVGNFDGSGHPAFTGRQAAAPLFFEVVDVLVSNTRHLETPHRTAALLGRLNITRTEVCSVSGRIPGGFCPHKRTTSFIPGISPIERCDIHRLLAIDLASGRRACPGQTAGTRQEVYEFWPTDLLTLFARAGIPRRTPPLHVGGCSLQARADFGVPPRILSPLTGIRYSLRARGEGNDRIAFTAIADADTTTLSWFLDEEFLGRSPAREVFFWKAVPGQFTVRAVDEHGRAATQEIRVAVVR
jgi:penicillin-binding protein 1C